MSLVDSENIEASNKRLGCTDNRADINLAIIQSNACHIGRAVRVFNRYLYAKPVCGDIADVTSTNSNLAYLIKFSPGQHSSPEKRYPEGNWHFAEECQFILPNDDDDDKDVVTPLDYVTKHTQAHKQLIDTMQSSLKMLETKGHDYGIDNFTKSAQIASVMTGREITATMVAASLVGIKIARYGQLISTGKTPKHESVQDTVSDLINYCGLTERERQKETNG